MTIPMNTHITPVVEYELPRPKDVGVLAIEVYFPRRVCFPFSRLLPAIAS